MRAFVVSVLALVIGLVGLIRHGPLGQVIPLLSVGAVGTLVFGALLYEDWASAKAARLNREHELLREGFRVSRQDDGFVISRVDPASGRTLDARFARGATAEQALYRARERLTQEA